MRNKIRFRKINGRRWRVRIPEAGVRARGRGAPGFLIDPEANNVIARRSAGCLAPIETQTSLIYY